MAEMQEKIEMANRVENQFHQLASEGKMKLFGDGQVEIVDDPDERSFMQESYRKDQLERQLVQEGEGQNLMDQFDPAGDVKIE